MRFPVRPPFRIRLALLSGALGLVVGCSSSNDTAKMTRDLLTLPKEEAYARGEALVKKKDYDLGRQYLRFVAENYASDPIGKQAALALADSYFNQGTTLGYLEAQQRYKDFRNRYPSSPKADYALFRLAQTADREAEKPDREQTNTRLAAASYRELILGYPDSPYIAEARARLARVRNLLADHEYIVGRFYNRRKAFTAAKGRFEVIVTAYPDYTKFDRVLFELGGVQHKLGNDKEAEAAWARLQKEFPNSQYVRKIPASAAPKAVAATAALTK